MDPNMVLVAAAVAAVLVLILVLRLALGGPAGNVVLILGPCDAGKTTLFHQLRDRRTLPTVASMEPNEADVTLKSDKAGGARPVRLVDVPGHPRVRGRFEEYVGRARGVVFLVDSVDFLPRKTEVAEQLYEVLAHAAVQRRRTPVLLACNKADLGTRAHTVDFLRKRLEKEIEALRGTRGALEDQSGGGGGASNAMGPPGEPFSFEGLAKARGVRVTAVSASAVDAGGAAEVEAFIRRCVPA